MLSPILPDTFNVIALITSDLSRGVFGIASLITATITAMIYL